MPPGGGRGRPRHPRRRGRAPPPTCPTAAGTALLDVARTAFVDGMQVTAAVAAVLALLLAAAALVALRTPAAEPAAAQPMPC